MNNLVSFLEKALTLTLVFVFVGCGTSIPSSSVKKRSVRSVAPLTAPPSQGSSSGAGGDLPLLPTTFHTPPQNCPGSGHFFASSVQIGTVTGCGEVDIPINVYNFCNIDSVSLTINYSVQNLEYIGVSETYLSQNTFVPNGGPNGGPDGGSGFVAISWYDGVNPSRINNGTLLKIRFRVSGNSNLAFSNETAAANELSRNGVAIPAGFSNGRVNYATSQCH